MIRNGRRRSTAIKLRPALEKIIENCIDKERDNFPTMLRLGSRYIRGIPRKITNITAKNQLLTGLHSLLLSQLQQAN